jgi:hypothetical protein
LSRVAVDPAERSAAEERARTLDPEGLTIAKPPVAEVSPPAVARVEPSDGQAMPSSRPAAEPAPVKVAPAVAKRVTERKASPDTVQELAACYRHPGRETSLRCNRCGRPICSSCARPTPVGYRCPECIREQEDAFFSARPIDYVLVTLVALPLSIVGALIASAIGWFALFLGAGLGGLIGKASFRAAGRRRGRFLPFVVAGAVVIGALPFALRYLASPNLFGLLLLGVYAVVAAGSAFYWMK